MIFTFFIATVFASQSFRGIANDDTVTGEYKKEKIITIKHTRDATTTDSAKNLGYGKLNADGNTATLTEKNKTQLTYTANSAEVDFGYLKYLKSVGENKLIVEKSDGKVITGDFAPTIAGTSVTLSAATSGQVPITITASGDYKGGKLFYYDDDTKSTELTYGNGKFSGKIDLNKLYSMEKSVNLGYVSAVATDEKLASSDIITVDIGKTADTNLIFNDDGKFVFTLTGPSNYQEFNDDLTAKEGLIDPGTKIADGADGYKLLYAEIDSNTKIPKSIEKVNLGKAPNVDLKFADQSNEDELPKLKIVSGKDSTETEVILNVAGIRTHIPITSGKSTDLDWIDFKKDGNKKGSIFVENNGKPASITKVVDDAKITFKIDSHDAEKAIIKYTVEPGLIKNAPTHRCIYNEAENKIVTGSAKCEPLKWAKGDPSEQSFEYKYSTLSKDGKSFVVITSSNVENNVKTDNIGEPFPIPQTEPVDPSGGAFGAVATIFAALVSLFVFAF